MSRDWEKELAKIDRQLESLPEEVPPNTRPAGGAPSGARGPAPAVGRIAAGPPAAAAAPAGRSGVVGVVLRLLLALGVAVAVMFWPYDARCGVGLAGYLGAVAGVVLAGGWSAVWTWRHRAGRAHVLSIAVVAWGLALAAAEVLPRVGYAKADPARALWVCE